MVTKNTTASDTKEVWKALSALSDEEWLNVLLRSIDESHAYGIELPRVPPIEVQLRFNADSGQSNLRAATTFYSTVKRYVASCGGKLGAESRVLDFGCGWGRLIRFFLRDVLGDNLHGLDVDAEAIETCEDTMLYGRYRQIQPFAPTDFAADSFDLIFAYSVFSHLPESVHIDWIKEFSRVLKPGGVLVVTTLGRDFIEQCQSLRENGVFAHNWQKCAAESFPDTRAALADYDRGVYLYSPKPDPLYGMAVLSPAYIKKEWTSFLDFRDFVDDPMQLSQAVIAMQKPMGPA